MARAIPRDQGERLRAAVNAVFDATGEGPDGQGTPREAFHRLVDVLESSPGAAVFPVDGTVSTQKAADILGISRMTVVRLIDRGELNVPGGAVHRRIPVSELARYRQERSSRRKAALTSLAHEVGTDTPADQIVSTR